MPSFARLATLAPTVAAVGGLILLAAPPLSAQTITRSVIGGGGARAGNGVVQIVGTIGQPAIGPATTATQSLDLGFWYTVGQVLGLPQITGLMPTAGTINGGTIVTLTGFNFAPNAVVTFDTGAATVVAATANEMTVVTPPHAAGLVGVSVAVAANATTRPNAYTFMPPGVDTDNDGLLDDCELYFSLDPLVAADATADPDGDGASNQAECTAGTHPRGFYKAFLAEGASNAFFSTRLALVNPGIAPATAITQFQLAGGTTLNNPSVVGPRTRATQQVADLPNAPVNDFATVVESDFPLVVDRTMTWAGGAAFGSHTDTSVPAPAADWYLAEGATHGRFDLFYLLQNPNPTPVDVTVRYLRLAFDDEIQKPYTVPGFGRHTIWVDREDPGLEQVEVSAAIHATQPIVAERAMYLSTASEPFTGGIAGAGTTTIGPRWFLAEGATGSFFDMYVLIGNPSASDASVRVTYLLEGGQNIQKLYTVHAGHRLTISVDQEDQALESAALSAIVESMNNVPIVVERTMWWPGDGNWREGHLATGAQTTGTRWAIAEGEYGGPANTQMYVLIANTSAFDGSAQVTLLFEDGTSAAQTVALPASSRVSVPMGLFPEANGRRFGATIESLGAPAAEIVVERAIYSDANGITWAAGSAALATKLP